MDFIQVSNLSYFFVALLLYKKKDSNANLVLIVFFVSALHHAFPSNRVLQRFDGTIANLCLLFLLPYYLTHKKKSFLYWASCQVFAFSICLYVLCGDEYKSTRYIVYHSLWHIVSALSLAVMIGAPDQELAEVSQCKFNKSTSSKRKQELNIKNEG
jgi:hypothetical protein